ncbi:MAG: GNAT family N-acetyltransferase [Bacteroidaceae bacterium]|nr:GNAT family N-acetyltransferase [Bacteroidaceae bacterium]
MGFAFHIRKATRDDIPALMRLFESAKTIMRASGNLHQWGVGYPSVDVVRRDIEQGVCYVATDGVDGEIEATMAFIQGPDPTYSYIEGGAWLNDEPYHVIHRIAVAKPGKGYARHLLDWAFLHTDTMRIDTHRDNVIMHHILRKYGFEYCGVIHLANGDVRDAYQLTKNS